MDYLTAALTHEKREHFRVQVEHHVHDLECCELFFGVTVQRYRHPPGPIEVPGLRDHLLVEHLAGPIPVEVGERRA